MDTKPGIGTELSAPFYLALGIDTFIMLWVNTVSILILSYNVYKCSCGGAP